MRTLELIAVVARPHLGLFASKLGGKASTNLGTPLRGPHRARTKTNGSEPRLPDFGGSTKESNCSRLNERLRNREREARAAARFGQTVMLATRGRSRSVAVEDTS